MHLHYRLVQGISANVGGTLAEPVTTGNGLGSLETAANPYIGGKLDHFKTPGTEFSH